MDPADMLPDGFEEYRGPNRFGAPNDGSSNLRELPPQVEAALRALESAFADARLSETFDACRHCYTRQDRAYLRSIAPSEMSGDDLARVAFSLTGTIGAADDIAYFVPAMLRAVLRGYAVEEAMVMKQLGRVPPEHWTAERRDALRGVFEAYFRRRPAEAVRIDLDDPGYRGWITEMLQRPPHGEPFERPIPGWDRTS